MLGLEAELEHDVLFRVVIVVDLDLVQDLVIEWKPVRPVAGFQQRIHTEDECDSTQEEVQKLTKKFEDKANDLAKAKEAEVMEE